MKGRPTGILILSIIHFLFGGFLLLMVIALAGLSLFFDQYLAPGNITSVDVLPSGFGMVLNVFILFIISVVTIVAGVGLLNGWPWIWYVEVLLIVSLTLNILYLSVTTISFIVLAILPISLLYYLTRPHVKEYFLGSEESEVIDEIGY